MQRPAPERVPRSGSQGERVNCYLVRIFRKIDDVLVVRSTNGNMLSCLEFDGSRYSVETEQNFESLLKYKFEFIHYHGLADTRYSGWFDFALGYIFKLPYIKFWLLSKKNNISQFIYNHKKLVTKQRIDLLKTILDAQLNGENLVSSIRVMSLMYSEKSFLHPDWEEYMHRIEFYLNALNQTNDLSKLNGDYSITGQGVGAIERYEEDERKHSENIRNQRKMFWLTLAITALTFVQAGLIKFPTIIDLTK